MRRALTVGAIMICCLGFVSGCSKRFVGQPINYNWEGWCLYDADLNAGEKHCRLPSGALIFDFTITRSENENDYLIDGHIDPTQGEIKSWGHMMDTGTRFSVVVANDGYVIDTISFRPVSAYGGLGNKLPFNIRFTNPEGFDAVAFVWKMSIRG